MVTLRPSVLVCCLPVAAIVFAGATLRTRATDSATCNIQGVWDLVNVTVGDRKEPVAGWKQRKVVTARHFMWVAQAERRDTLPLRTALDSMRVGMVGAGAGSYTLNDSTYTETIEFFNDPAFIGKPWPATCRTVGDRWYHSFTQPARTGPDSGARVVEEWRRVE